MNFHESVLYVAVLATVLFLVPAYAMLLRYWALHPEAPEPELPAAPAAGPAEPLPFFTIVVPVFNEESFVVWKLQNTLDLEYPAHRRRILVVDGGSTDETFELAARFARSQSAGAIQVVRSPGRGKIPQLNHALSMIPAEHYVVLTDADAEIHSPGALLAAARAIRSGVGVFGGFTTPPTDGEVPQSEKLFWALQNRIRQLESASFSSNIALAPFYAFPRTLFERFPDNCVADDVYVSFVSHARSRRVIYSEAVRVTERRFPVTAMESYLHKLRKTRAYTVELLRSLPNLSSMRARARAGCLFRLVMFGYWPWAALYNLIWLPTHLASSPLAPLSVGLSTLAACGILVSAMSKSVRPGGRPAAVRVVSGASYACAELSVLLLAALISSFVLTPFAKQDSIYRKVTGSF